MQTLLAIAVTLITLSIIAQAAIFAAMYVLSRRLSRDVNKLIDESRKLITPLETITNNLKSVSDDMAEISKNARQDLGRVDALLKYTVTAVQDEIQDLRQRLNQTVDEMRGKVTMPLRQFSALGQGLAEGVRTFFSKQRPEEKRARQYPAA